MKKNIFYMILGGILFSTITVFAYNLVSGDVLYETSSLVTDSNQNGYIDVKDALDDLYEKTSTDSSWVKRYETFSGIPTNYAYDRTPTSSTTSDYTTLGHIVYLGLYEEGGYGVCVNLEGTQHCFRKNNWIAESKHMQEAYSELENYYCDVSEYYVSCESFEGTRDKTRCLVSVNGDVECRSDIQNEKCEAKGGDSTNTNTMSCGAF